MKPRWFQNGFKFFVLKPPLIGGGFTRFWRFFFLGKVSGPKNDPILAKIHHMLGFKQPLMSVDLANKERLSNYDRKNVMIVHDK